MDSVLLHQQGNQKFMNTTISCAVVVGVCALVGLATNQVVQHFAQTSQTARTSTRNTGFAVRYTRHIASAPAALQAASSGNSQEELNSFVQAQGSSTSFSAIATPFVLAAIGGMAYLLSGSRNSKAAELQPLDFHAASPTFMNMAAVSGESGASTATASEDIDLDNLNPSDMEIMYIDALWAYYTEGKAIMTDEQFAKLKDELNWQGSGFPTLHREEIEFVKAVLANAQGKPILSDDEYDKLKERVKAQGPKRKDVTAFLLMIKGKQLLDPEKYKQLRGQMKAAGVSASPASIAGTLSETPNTLQYQVLEVLSMYSALGLVPTALCASAWGFLGFIMGGLQGVQTVATVGFPVIGASSFLLTREMVRYLELTGPKLVKGVCPCCESPIEASFFDVTPAQKVEKCPNCGTLSTLDSEKMMITDAAGFSFIGESGDKKTVDQYLSWASGVTSGILVGKNPISQLGGRKGEKEGPKPTTVGEMVQQEIKVGIFAWAVLLGYAIFGEQFVGRARGKGIAIHSGVINDFCKRFNIPNGLRQKYIQTAKRNGHDLGFLVDANNLIGDGLFGKQAMAWWKAQGW